jgi:hypothetical protein
VQLLTKIRSTLEKFKLQDRAERFRVRLSEDMNKSICKLVEVPVPHFFHSKLRIFNIKVKHRIRLTQVKTCDGFCGINRVARWFVFKPKIPIWVNFGEP